MRETSSGRTWGMKKHMGVCWDTDGYTRSSLLAQDGAASSAPSCVLNVDHGHPVEAWSGV